jgi:hypothetical protein
MRSVLTRQSKLKPLQLKSKNTSIMHLRESGHDVTYTSLMKDYGNMLPKSGIYSLPDFKVTAFMRILTDYHKQLEIEQKYLESKQARIKFKRLSKIELKKQMRKT